MYYQKPQVYRVFEVDDLSGLETPTNRYLHPGECDDYLEVRNANPHPISRRVIVKPVYPILSAPQLA